MHRALLKDGSETEQRPLRVIGLEVDMEELVSRLNELDAKIRHIQERL